MFGAGHPSGCNCFNCLTPADEDEPLVVSRRKGEVEVLNDDLHSKREAKPDANTKSLALLQYQPISIGYAIRKFTTKLKLAFSAPLGVNGSGKRKKGKRSIRTAKFRFLKKNFRSILKIKKIQDKWMCCKLRFDAADLEPLARKIPVEKMYPFVKISTTQAVKITKGDPSLDSVTKWSPKKRTRKKPSLVKSATSNMTEKVTEPAVEDSGIVEEQGLSKEIDILYVDEMSPLPEIADEIQIDCESEEQDFNAMDVEVEVQPSLLKVTSQEFSQESHDPPHDISGESCSLVALYLSPPPLEDSIPESEFYLMPLSPTFRCSGKGKRNSTRKRLILDSDDEQTCVAPSEPSEKLKEPVLKPCHVRMERINTFGQSKVYKRIRTVKAIPDDARKLMYGAETARQRTSDSESDVDFRPSAINSSCSSSESTLSNETESPSSPSSEDSDVVVESEEYGASELEEEEERHQVNQNQMKPMLILKTVDERRKLKEERLKIKGKKRRQKKTRSDYRKTHFGHLGYSPVNISYAVEVLTKKLHWDIFPFGAKVLGQTLRKKELDSLSKSQESAEWSLLKKAFVLKHFREVFRIKGDASRDFVCCKNMVDVLDCKAFLKTFFDISIH